MSELGASLIKFSTSFDEARQICFSIRFFLLAAKFFQTLTATGEVVPDGAPLRRFRPYHPHQYRPPVRNNSESYRILCRFWLRSREGATLAHTTTKPDF